MGEAAVDQKQLDQIGTFVKDHIGQWIREQNLYAIPQGERGLDKELLERMITVEQQLKFQNEKLELMMQQSDKRFDESRQYMEKRFDSAESRYNDLREDMNLRFDESRQSMDKRFDESQKAMDKRFESAESRYIDLREDMNLRFDAVNQKFNRVYGFLSGIFLTMLGGFVTLLIKTL